MLSVPSYREAWERKQQWYEDNSFLDRIITSEDGADGSIDAVETEQIARDKVILRDQVSSATRLQSGGFNLIVSSRVVTPYIC